MKECVCGCLLIKKEYATRSLLQYSIQFRYRATEYFVLKEAKAAMRIRRNYVSAIVLTACKASGTFIVH